MKGIALFIISLVIGFAGCGESNEHAIFRSGDMITVYWILQENEEIANFELSDNILALDIDTGKSREKQMLPINFAADHESLELKGMSELDALAIFHVIVNPTMESHSELPATRTVYTTYREYDHFDTKPGDFTKARAFRSGDRITVYWHNPEKPKKLLLRWARGHGKSDMWVDGRDLPDNWTEELSITDVEPHEKITWIGIGKTPEIFIGYFRVSSNPTH